MKESDIRPQQIFEQYLALSKADANTFFKDVPTHAIPCPGCGAQSISFEFTKNSFRWASCEQCDSLFVTPRPEYLAFKRFYSDAISSRFWAEEFFPQVEDKRRIHLFRPKAARIIEILSQFDSHASSLMDVGAGHGILLEELRVKAPHLKFFALEPSPSMAQICRSKSFEVIQETAEELSEEIVDAAVSLEVLEHVYDPVTFLHSLNKAIRPNGLIILSTLCSSGFDIQLLWENSNSVSPPHHINLLSRTGLQELFKRAGFQILNVSTPGKLDIDITLNSTSNPQTIGIRRFLTTLKNQDPALLESFQDFLASNLLSSHIWIVAKKTNERQ